MFKRTQRTNDRSYCCVPQCKTQADKNPDVRFHRFPQKYNRVWMRNSNNELYSCSRREAWILALRIGKEVTKRMVVCSLHFKPSDYNKHAYPVSKAFLKVTAVPSQNLPVTPSGDAEKIAQNKRKYQPCIKIDKVLGKEHPTKLKKGLEIFEKSIKSINTDEIPSAKSFAASLFKRTTNNSVDSYLEHQQGETDGPENPPSTDAYLSDFIAEDETQSSICTLNNEVKDFESIQFEESEIPVSSTLDYEDIDVVNNYSEDIGTPNSISETQCEGAENSRLEKERNKNGESDCSVVKSETSTQRKDQNFECTIDEREKAFGLLLVSEISTLHKNPQLYVRTKQKILNVVADAQMELLTEI